MKNDIEDNIIDFVDIFYNNIEKEKIEKYSHLIDKFKDNPYKALDELTMSYCDIYTVLKKILNIKNEKNEWLLEYIVNGTYEHFIEKLIEIREVSCCSSDRTKFIVDKTLSSLIDDVNYSLYDDYTKYPNCNIKNKNEQAYWSPVTIKNVEEAIEYFKLWYFMIIPEDKKDD